MVVTENQTPVEYNGGQLDKLPGDAPNRFLLGVDWVEISCRGDLGYLIKSNRYVKGDWEVVASDIRSRHFNCASNVFYRGALFGVMLFRPRSRVIPVEVVQFKVDNQHFYKEGHAGRLNQTIKLFLDAFELTFHNFTRLDVYIDFYRFNPNLSFSEFVAAYSSGQIDVKGKISKWNPYFTKIDGKMTLTGFSMGSRKSDKYVRCYNKSLEIKESNKGYITEYWGKNGLSDAKHDVFRFELELSSKFFKTVSPFRLVTDNEGNTTAEKIETGLLSISRPESLFQLLQVAMKNYFEFYVQDNVVRNDNKIPFEVFDWLEIKKGLQNIYRYVRQKLNHQKCSWRQKMLVARNLFREYVVSLQDATWLKSAVKIIHEYGLYKRWEKMCEKYVEEFLHQIPYSFIFDYEKLNGHWSHEVALLKAIDKDGKRYTQIEIKYDPIRKAYYKD